MKETLIAMLLLLSFDGANAESWITVSGLSYHPGRGDLNSYNYGVGVQSGGDAVQFMAGAYRNSFRRTTAYAGVRYLPVATEWGRFGVSAALVTGYEFPVAVFPTFATKYADFFATPKIGNSPAMVGMQIRYKL